MKILQQNAAIVFFSCCFLALLSFFIWNENPIGYLIPFALLLVYTTIFYTQVTFFLVLACTPLSINIEEFSDGIGLFLPTEPLLLGTFLLLIWQSFKWKVFPDFLLKSALSWAILVYISWLCICTFSSSHPLASIKFILARLWFIVPVYCYGAGVFDSVKKVRLFIWLFLSSMTVAMLYTIIMHASYGFGEKESHWVMWPFFKDHTIYGALVALVIPFPFALLFSKKMSPIAQFILIGMIVINLLALYFSYTRAAQLSVILALGVIVLIYYRIKFSYVFGAGIFVLLILFFSFDQINQDLAKNKSEHTTENFGDRLQSATNVTTDASNVERINRWTCALDMFKERPVFGFGPGTYAFEYAPFQRPENLTIISTNFGDGGNAHSEFLGPLAETGLIGMLIVLALVICIFYEGITLYNSLSTEEKELKAIILCFIFALSTYFIHAFLNNYWDTDKAAVPIWTICAVFISFKYRKTKNNPTKKLFRKYVYRNYRTIR